MDAAELREIADKLERLERFEHMLTPHLRRGAKGSVIVPIEEPEEALQRILAEEYATRRILIETVPAHGDHREHWLALYDNKPQSIPNLLEHWLKCRHCGEHMNQHYANGKCLYQPTTFALDVEEQHTKSKKTP